MDYRNFHYIIIYNFIKLIFCLCAFYWEKKYKDFCTHTVLNVTEIVDEDFCMLSCGRSIARVQVLVLDLDILVN